MIYDYAVFLCLSRGGFQNVVHKRRKVSEIHRRCFQLSVYVPVYDDVNGFFVKDRSFHRGPVSVRFAPPVATADIPGEEKRGALTDQIYGIINGMLQI
jgi:hypothetical protein